MKKTFLICMGICLFFISTAQISVINPDNNRRTFELSSVPTNPPLIQRAANNDPGTIGSNPRSAFVFEYGDGSFTTDSFSSHIYKAPGVKQTVLTLSGRYDTIKPPQVFTSSFNIPTPGGEVTFYSDFSHQSLLDSGKSIKLTPIARDLNVRDEMLFIITYRIPPGANNPKLILFYNDSAFNVFDPIDTTSLISLGASDLKRIRTHFSEIWSQTDFNNTSLTGSISGLAGTKYQNVLAWTFNDSVKTQEEHNVFISIRTKDNLTSLATGYIEAVLQYEIEQPDGGEESLLDISSLNMTVSANPHDPNYINVTPKCIRTGSGTTRVNYHLHFQNEGGGTAHRLKIKIDMDSRLKNAIAALSEDSFRIITGRKPVNNSDFILTKYSNTLEFDIQLYRTPSPGDQQSNNQAAIDSSLGSNKVPAWYCNPLTMGDIYFQLDVPDTSEADFITQASIIFYNQGDVAMPAVETAPDTLFIRKQCTGNILPHIIPLKTCPACTPCCTKFVGLCWWWWIAIGLALVFIIWLFTRKKRNKGNSYNS